MCMYVYFKLSCILYIYKLYYLQIKTFIMLNKIILKYYINLLY